MLRAHHYSFGRSGVLLYKININVNYNITSKEKNIYPNNEGDVGMTI